MSPWTSVKGNEENWWIILKVNIAMRKCFISCNESAGFSGRRKSGMKLKCDRLFDGDKTKCSCFLFSPFPFHCCQLWRPRPGAAVQTSPRVHSAHHARALKAQHVITDCRFDEAWCGVDTNHISNQHPLTTDHTTTMESVYPFKPLRYKSPIIPYSERSPSKLW